MDLRDAAQSYLSSKAKESENTLSTKVLHRRKRSNIHCLNCPPVDQRIFGQRDSMPPNAFIFTNSDQNDFVPQTYLDAVEQCECCNGILAEPEDQDDLDSLANALATVKETAADQNFWVGYNDLRHPDT